MNRVTHCGIERPSPVYSLAEGAAVQAKLDQYLDKKIAEWSATVPHANHLESKKLDSKWYRRHTIEHVWRILRYLIREEADVEKVLRYFDDIQTILAMYFRELYEATVDIRVEDDVAA
ncbi:hypothetical protein R69746_08703 [Paraburkholderia aspalathi]|uniref:hypothetical protein n=1 Tax=Paraburkholderia aspalathi TaxID=1324617 RepID=UPI00190CC680|nr:hypothetical protein [Paraburkholderia aspalathi]MBK3844591.1 hypothetical protein [Paraburkholderia aspalathi]CAE6874869.1 hypothetical protein R69746_08703 [Paraburkholderia aspalathi]CAE6875273.1 hypothetical protein R75465_08566 [Paraburkholderia aspalathi]